MLNWLLSPQATRAPQSGVLAAKVPIVRQAELTYDQSAANAFTLSWLKVDHTDPAKRNALQVDVARLRDQALSRSRSLTRKWQQDPRHKLSINEWFSSSYALMQAGDKDAVAKITRALASQQAQDGVDAGSWQPIGVWGDVGGRTWTTAMAVLTLEAPYRYAKIVGR